MNQFRNEASSERLQRAHAVIKAVDRTRLDTLTDCVTEAVKGATYIDATLAVLCAGEWLRECVFAKHGTYAWVEPVVVDGEVKTPGYWQGGDGEPVRQMRTWTESRLLELMEEK